MVLEHTGSFTLTVLFYNVPHVIKSIYQLPIVPLISSVLMVKAFTPQKSNVLVFSVPTFILPCRFIFLSDFGVSKVF